MWAAAAMLMVGDDLLRARADDSEPRIPIGTVGGYFQLQHGIALPRVLAMLQYEHGGAAAGQSEPRSSWESERELEMGLRNVAPDRCGPNRPRHPRQF